MSKKGRLDNERRARLQAVQAEQRRTRHRRTAAIAAVSVVAVGAVVAGIVFAVVRRDGPPSATQPGGTISGVQTYTGLGRDHVTGTVTYPQTPPVGGNHSAIWQNCGVYATPVVNENAVHSLEHGVIWITYQPNLAADQISALRSAVAGQAQTLVSPYPGLPSPVAVTGWGVQLKLDSANDPRLRAFLAAYKSGSQAPEPGGECTGGVGTPSS